MEEEPEVGELWIFAYSNAKQAECRRNFLKEGFHHEKSYVVLAAAPQDGQCAARWSRSLSPPRTYQRSARSGRRSSCLHQKSRPAKKSETASKSDLWCKRNSRIACHALDAFVLHGTRNPQKPTEAAPYPKRDDSLRSELRTAQRGRPDPACRSRRESCQCSCQCRKAL